MTTEKLAERYRSGSSLPDLSRECGLPVSTLRLRLIQAGVQLRTRAEGIRMAGPKMSAQRKGKKRAPFTETHRQRIAEARRRAPTKGIRLTSNGYLEFTRGPYKGRLVHDVVMEEHLGRRLMPGECVRHKDECKTNNDLGNLELTTHSEHTRHHRRSRHTREE